MALSAASRSLPTETNPFNALDADWAVLCRRHRRSVLVARWALAEPALRGARTLADVIPPDKADRADACKALARLAAQGEDLAARALLQLLLPGLVSTAAQWSSAYGGTWAAGLEVLASAVGYIARLGHGVSCHPAFYVLRSVKRDLATEARKARTAHLQLVTDEALADLVDTHSRSRTAPSAEHDALSGPLMQAVLDEAVRRGEVPDVTAQLLWLEADGHSALAAAESTGVPRWRAYRLRAEGLAAARRHLTVAEAHDRD